MLIDWLGKPASTDGGRGPGDCTAPWSHLVPRTRCCAARRAPIFSFLFVCPAEHPDIVMTRAVDADFLAKFAQGGLFSCTMVCICLVFERLEWLPVHVDADFLAVFVQDRFDCKCGCCALSECITCGRGQPQASAALCACINRASPCHASPPLHLNLSRSQATRRTALATGPPHVPCLRRRWPCGATAAATPFRTAPPPPCCGE